MRRIAILFFTIISAMSAFCQTHLEDGDRCFDNGDYYCAITKYNEAFKLAIGKDKQIAEIRVSRAKWCADHIKTADLAFKSKDYKISKDNYQSVLDTNPNDSYAKEQLVKCSIILNPPETPLNNSKGTNEDSRILNLIKKQGGEYKYSEINPKVFNDFVNINYNAMNLLIKNYNDKGTLNYSTAIQFDHQGNNQSELTIHSISDNKFKPFLSSIKPSEIQPSRISNQFVRTTENLDFNLSWKTTETKAFVRSHNIEIEKIKELDYNQKSTIESYISNHSYKSGIYTFKVTRKQLNENNYYDLAFSSFTNNNGPMNFLYSLLLPGLGTSKVTEGHKGKGKMIFFLITAAISAGSRIYSLNQYDQYLDDPANGAQYYTNADIANKVFLVSGGVAATIYIYDIFYVFGRGLKNHRENRSLKKELSIRPIFLVNSPLIP
jgi:hypothetical protein